MNSSLAIRGWKSFLSWDKSVAALLILAGVVLRLRQYLLGRSLWVDEAMLALNIVERDFAGMFQPLDYDQGAPIGFLLVQKLFHSVLGKHELALRFFPLLAGLISLLLFYLLLKRFTSETSGAGLLVALALFAFNPRLIYYSSEVKQYIVDVAVTIALLLIAVPMFRAAPGKKDFTWLGFAGLLALWLSHSALFVLAGIGLAMLAVTVQRQDHASLRRVLGLGAVWLVNIAFLYLLILQDLSRNAYMKEYWEGAFLPVPPWNQPGWLAKSLHENIGTQFGIPYAVYLVFFLMLVGWVILWFQQRGHALAMAGIALFTLTASALQLYPVFERMILFLVPVGLLLIGKAFEAIYVRLQRYPVVGLLAVVLLAGYLLYGPVVTSLQNFLAPKYFEHIRPMLETLRDSRNDGDALYVSYGAVPAFRFYASFYELEDIPYEAGEREDYKAIHNMAKRLASFDRQPRVWILLSHVYETEGFNEREFVLNTLNEMGERSREFRVPGTSVYLYLYDLANE